MQILVLYAITAVIFLGLDAVGLSKIMRPLFETHISDMLRADGSGNNLLSDLRCRTALLRLGAGAAWQRPDDGVAERRNPWSDRLRHLRVHGVLGAQGLALADGRHRRCLGHGTDRIFRLGGGHADALDHAGVKLEPCLGYAGA